MSFFLLGCGAATADEPHIIINSIGMKFVRIPAGEFLMGSRDDDKDANADERPQHRVRISRAFYLGVYEVTRDEYERVVGELPEGIDATLANRGLDFHRTPVEYVTWDEAKSFCDKVSATASEREAGHSYRLPTEAEWEYACRAGTTTRYHLNETDVSHFWTMKANAYLVPLNYSVRDFGYIGTVGEFPANPWGLHDMHGNVWEWCSDAYSPDAYEADAARAVNGVTVDPKGPVEGTGRVIRGGDYRSKPSEARSANRDFTRQTRRDLGNGFRVVLQLDAR